MRVPLPAATVETIQVIIPDERERGDQHRGQDEETDRESEEVELPLEGAVGVEIYRPDVHEHLDDVRDDGESPRDDSPAGHEAGACGGAVVLRAVVVVVVLRGREAAQFHRALGGGGEGDGAERVGRGHDLLARSWRCSVL